MAKLRTRNHKVVLNRSAGGDVGITILLVLMGAFMFLPMYYVVIQALKPLDELWMFPPRFFVLKPTLSNFGDLFSLMNQSWVPFSRYIFNTVFISFCGTFGNLLLASMAAYAMAKLKFPGRNFMFQMIVLSLMFHQTVNQVTHFIILSALGWIDTYLAIIAPALAGTMGLYLMKQFMEQLPDSLMESARLDGASEWRIFWSIVMPNVKPAWLTLAIFQFQQMWGNTGSTFLRDEDLKPLQYALQQISAGGTARAGAAAAVTFIIAAVPITFFLICQKNVLETMTSSGMKD